MNNILDKILIQDLETKVSLERATTAEILRLIREVDSRKLHLKMGYHSLFHFMIKHLHYSEGGAYRRISAARLLESLGELAPLIEDKIESGDLNLTQLNIAKQVLDFQITQGKRPHSDEENADLLKSFEGKSTRECKIEASKITGTKLPEIEVLQVGSEGETRITVTLDQETVELLSQFKSRTAHKNPLADTALALKLALKTALEKTAATRQSFNGKVKQKETRRGVSKSMRSQVLERDGGCCQFKNTETGRKCESKFKLEVDHIQAWSRGGKTTLDNLQTLCFNHNQMKSNLF
jgi:hypothetical protein